MKVPQRRIAEWARELIDECSASRDSRIQAGATWRQWYLLGSDTGVPARYNKMITHINRLASYLYSPISVQFSIEMDASTTGQWKEELAIAGSFLTRDFHRRGVDVSFAEAIKWSLVKGCTFLKQVWGHDGIDAWVVQPEMMGVLREDIQELSRQEAFFHSTYLTPGMVRRILTGRGDSARIMQKVKTQSKKSADDPARDDMFKQVIIGGVQPVSSGTVNNPAGGIVNWMNGSMTELSPHVIQDLVRFDELWVLDDDRQDWTTIQILGEDIVLEGDLRHTNLCGIEGMHPFVQICPNPLYGYLWGRSECASLWTLQDGINKRLQGIEDVWRRQEDPARAFVGMGGITDEKVAKLNTPGGWLAEAEPNGKIEDMTPKLPEGAMQELHDLFAMFDDIAGMTPTITGHGEQGVRAQAHAETLVRTSSPQLRDRALLVERQCEDAGDLAFRMLQAHDATAFPLKNGSAQAGMMAKLTGGGREKSFLLNQLPEDIHVNVDSHSASPAFSMEMEQRAFALNARGAISGPDLIRLTPIEHKDSLIASAEERERIQAELIAKNPELLMKGKSKR